jgi:hypothetical protein
MRKIFVLAAAIVLAASNVHAQSQESTRAGMSRTNLVSSNPIGLLFEWYNGEFEHAISSTASIAVAASVFSGNDFDLDDEPAMGDVIARYYPAARALRGLSVGLSAGIIRVTEDVCTEFSCNSKKKSSSGTIGVRGDYVWIIGRDQHFSVATGIGARRILNDNISFDFFPIGRLSLGYAW